MRRRGRAPPAISSPGDAARLRVVREGLARRAVDGGLILVSFDDKAAVEHRLSAAAVIFRLSPGQLRLSQHIVDGHDLTRAAAALGIGVSATRTQLHRIFDKTGVHSQPALVRALLSAGTPVG